MGGWRDEVSTDLTHKRELRYYLYESNKMLSAQGTTETDFP